MNTEKVISREYKVMLKASKFEGDTEQLLASAAEFWQAFKQKILDLVFDTDGSLKKIEKKREIEFYEAGDIFLYSNSYIFRKRTDIDSREEEVTLKFRHPDRYIAQDRNMDAANKANGKTKFEQDIKPKFNSVYSFSTKQDISSSQQLRKLDDIGDLFPDLKKQLPHYNPTAEIRQVADFTAKEIVIEGADFEIQESPKVEAECALVVWYDNNGDQQKPVVAEFSFKYENEDEEYTGEEAKRAYKVFLALQELEAWVDPNSKTKTAYFYSLASS